MKLLLALLVFSIAWPISARRVTRDVAELVVATGLQVAVLVLLAVFLPGCVWKTVLVLYLVFPRVVAPLMAWRVAREPVELRLVPFTDEAEGVSGRQPPGSRSAWTRCAAADSSSWAAGSSADRRYRSSARCLSTRRRTSSPR